MADRARLLRAARRRHLVAFNEKVFHTLDPGTRYEHNWHLDHLCWQLTRVARGEVRRLILNVPPRSMKSITVSIGFTAWLLGQDPTKRIICASYADDLARKLSVDTRAVMESPWYQGLFPGTRLAAKRPRNIELITTRRGSRYAAGMNGAILGRGADLIVIDDPIKATDALSQAERRRVNETYDSTVLTRLNDKRTGAIVIIMQRLHEDDLVGHVTAAGEWEVVSIPAIAMEERAYRLSDDPEDVYLRQAGEVLYAREPREILETIRRAQGSLTFSAQYQQSPVPPQGNIVKREWLRYYSQAPSEFDLVMASWDTSRRAPTSRSARSGAPRGSTSTCSTLFATGSRCRSFAGRCCGLPASGAPIRPLSRTPISAAPSLRICGGPARRALCCAECGSTRRRASSPSRLGSNRVRCMCRRRPGLPLG
jgi:hypothetical protein